MMANATITVNPARRQVSPRRDRVRKCSTAKRALVLAVLVMVVVLPVTGSISITDIARSPRVETARLDCHHSIYSLPHLPHPIDSPLDAWENHQRNRYAVCVP